MSARRTGPAAEADGHDTMCVTEISVPRLGDDGVQHLHAAMKSGTIRGSHPRTGGVMTGCVRAGDAGYARQAARRRRHSNATSAPTIANGALLPSAADPSPGWQDHAACAAADPSLFDGQTAGDMAAAEAICAGCPVRTGCLQFALDGHIAYGVWGGVHLGETSDQAAS